MKLLTFLYMAPGNHLADRVGAADEHERGLIRSLVNTLIWTSAGAAVFFVAAFR